MADWCALASAAQNVTGEARRAVIAAAIEDVAEGYGVRLRGTQLVEVPARAPSRRLLADRLPPAARARWIASDPVARVGGEFLPPYRSGEEGRKR